MVRIARGGMFRLQIWTGSIIGVAVIGYRYCSCLCYFLNCPFYCCCYFYCYYHYYHHPQTTHPSSRQSPLRNTDQRYQNNSSTTNPYHATILTSIYTTYTKSFYVVLTYSSTLYHWMSSLLSITIIDNKYIMYLL